MSALPILMNHLADSSAAPELQIDPAAIAANTRLIASRTAGELMAVVKADGYGHDAALVARVALENGASWLGVTSIDEALRLRDAGLSAPILSWLNPVDADVDSAVRSDIDLAVPSLEHLAAIESAVIRSGRGKRARLHLYIDCGMARDGIAPQLWSELCRRVRIAERRGLVQAVGIMGHLGCAEDPGDPCNEIERLRFSWANRIARSARLRPGYRHLASTAATLTDPLSHYDLSRVGAGLVGIDPSTSTVLRGAMTLRSPIVGVRAAAEGTFVGYGHAWRSPRSTTLALVPLGYADGIPRAVSGHAEVQFRGRRHPVVGRISMDQVVIDVGDTHAVPGEMVTMFGPGDDGEPTIADWARWAGTIAHEIVTGIGARVRRNVTAQMPEVMS